MPTTRFGRIVLVILAALGAVAIVAFLIMLVMHGRMTGGQRSMRGGAFQQPRFALADREVVR